MRRNELAPGCIVDARGDERGLDGNRGERKAQRAASKADNATGAQVRDAAWRQRANYRWFREGRRASNRRKMRYLDAFSMAHAFFWFSMYRLTAESEAPPTVETK